MVIPTRREHFALLARFLAQRCGHELTGLRMPWFVRRQVTRWTGPELGHWHEGGGVAPGLVDRLDDVPAGARVLITAHYVATVIRLPGGDLSVSPLTPCYATRGRAEQERQRLLSSWPSCECLSLAMYLDPIAQRADVEQWRHKELRELMRVPGTA